MISWAGAEWPLRRPRWNSPPRMMTRSAPMRAHITCVCILLSAIRAASAQCDTWTAGPLPDLATLNGPVYCQAVWDLDDAGPLPPRLVVGGLFTMAGSLTVNHIAQWDGARWLPLGAGVTGGASPQVNALTVYNGDLIAG